MKATPMMMTTLPTTRPHPVMTSLQPTVPSVAMQHRRAVVREVLLVDDRDDDASEERNRSVVRARNGRRRSATARCASDE